ncbi:MAG: hypothetical protein WED08_01180 [Patescibacteria group bacterium]
MAISDGGVPPVGGSGLCLSGEAVRLQLRVVGRLLKSELYYSRLRRTLVNGWDPKVLTDFLVMDDLVLVVLRALIGGDDWKALVEMRGEVFSKALESARRKLDVRVHDQMERLQAFLLARNHEVTADQVLDAAYGEPKK